MPPGSPTSLPVEVRTLRLEAWLQRIGTVYDSIPVKARLSLSYSLWMGVFYSFIGAVMYKVVERNLHDSVNASLLSAAETLRDVRFAYKLAERNDVLVDPVFQETWHLSQFLNERSIRPMARIVRISETSSDVTEEQQVVLPLSPQVRHRASYGLTTIETFAVVGRSPVRIVTLPITLNRVFTGEVIQVGLFLGTTLDTLHSTAYSIAAALVIALLTSVVFGYALASRALRPVGEITRTAANMDSDALSTRLPLPRARDEIRVLSETFNHLFARLDDSLNRLRRFSGDVSHELRTPLAVLRGEAELALRRERTPEQYREVLTRICSESQSMSRIVEELLLLAKVQSGHMALEREVFYVATVLDDLANDVSPVYESKQVKLECSRDQESRQVAISYTYFTLAMKNILFNAVKHSRPQGTVWLGAETVLANRMHAAISSPQQRGMPFKWLGQIYPHHDYVVFSVRDEGNGIPQDQLATIFDPFTRVDSARNRMLGGFGIGLSLTRALIELHRGGICVSSQEGAGCLFQVYIPLGPARRHKEEVSSRAPGSVDSGVKR